MAETNPEDLSLVLDVPVTLQVHLGETTLTIGDILKCGKGSVIPLNQKVGDPFLITIQKRAIAEGEVVEAGDRLGIKITNILKNGGAPTEAIGEAAPENKEPNPNGEKENK